MTADYQPVTRESERFVADDLFCSAVDTVHNIYRTYKNGLWQGLEQYIYYIFCTQHEFSRLIKKSTNL